MMKSLQLFLVLLFFGTSVYAQTTLGFKVGPNLDFYEVVTTSDVKTRDYETYFGIHFGMSLDVPVYEDIISFTPDLQLRVINNGNEADNNTIANVDIPLMFTAYLYPTFGLDLGPELRYEVYDVHRVGDEWLKDEAPVKKFDFGIAGGARFGISDNSTILLRLYLGLNNLYDADAAIVPSDISQKIFTRSVQISFITGGGGRSY